MKGLSARKSKDLLEHILIDYHFLEDYQVLDSLNTNKNNFVACIKNTEQMVRFRKLKYDEEVLPRFKALHRLYTNGIVLADNLFVLEQCEEFYYYVIEAEIALNNARFQTLQQYLYNNQPSVEESKTILGKIKILVDCLHQQGQAYAGLDPRKIIIDDENHLYLAPFDLEFELKTDNYSRAYYPPEILHKISKGDGQINEQMMQKWDIWSFGCICMEILAYTSPLFLCTSLPKQVKMIEQFVFPELQNHQESIRNIVNNSLTKDSLYRTISTNVLDSPKRQIYEIDKMCAQTIQNIDIIKKEHSINGVTMKQLNILEQNEGDCLFTLDLFTLSNINIEKQLHITVYLGKAYHFYIDYNEQNPNKYVLNRRLTIKGFFNVFQKWLSLPIQIQLKQENKNTRINVNAQSFVMIHNQQRIWQEPIIGTFSSTSASDFPKARIKLKCSFTAPQTIIVQEKKVLISHNPPKKENKIEENVQEQKSSQKQIVKQADQQNVLKQKSLNKLHQKSAKSTSKIPTISEISQSLTLLTEQLRRKMTPQDIQQDPIQKQLSSLLQLQ